MIRKKLIIIFILIFVLAQIAIAVGTYFYNVNVENNNIRDKMNMITEQSLLGTRDTIDIFKNSLSRTTALFESYNGIVPYDIYYNNLQFDNLKNFPIFANSADLFLWTQKVQFVEKNNFQYTMTVTNNYPFFMYEINPNPPQLRLVENRTVYWPIVYHTLSHNVLNKHNLQIDYYSRMKDKKGRWIIDDIYLPVLFI